MAWTNHVKYPIEWKISIVSIIFSLVYISLVAIFCNPEEDRIIKGDYRVIEEGKN